MSDLKKAAQQALDALYDIDATGVPVGHIDLVIDTLKAALAQEQEQEPVASQNTQEKCRIETVPAKGGLLSIHPPRREWQSLTEEDIWTLAANCLDSVLGRLHFARAIEAALKERNT
jgi:hypothetical protein